MEKQQAGELEHCVSGGRGTGECRRERGVLGLEMLGIGQSSEPETGSLWLPIQAARTGCEAPSFHVCGREPGIVRFRFSIPFHFECANFHSHIHFQFQSQFRAVPFPVQFGSILKSQPDHPPHPPACHRIDFHVKQKIKHAPFRHFGGQPVDFRALPVRSPPQACLALARPGDLVPQR